MTSDFASEIAKYLQNSDPPKIAPSRISITQINVKFRRPYRKLGSPSKNTTSDFASEVAKYPPNPENPQNSSKWDLHN